MSTFGFRVGQQPSGIVSRTSGRQGKECVLARRRHWTGPDSQDGGKASEDTAGLAGGRLETSPPVRPGRATTMDAATTR